jgi:hypothetical protein
VKTDFIGSSKWTPQVGQLSTGFFHIKLTPARPSGVEQRGHRVDAATPKATATSV